ncbi:hypothetical protein DY000_02029399 [Brassica cretica]|uniref:Uncharacterized protein n=1 Tax=Brassica cretica TaxID=69181 RepID=A0ABQ7DXW3_BRACR|nr:hypothetical protein DY000_02029399 [Brassica cretica]
MHHGTHTSEGSSNGNCGLSVSLGKTISAIPDVELIDSEAKGSEAKIEPGSVPVILKCSSLDLEPTEAKTPGEMALMLEVDVVPHVNSILDGEPFYEEESYQEIENDHVQVTDYLVKPSLRIDELQSRMLKKNTFGCDTFSGLCCNKRAEEWIAQEIEHVYVLDVVEEFTQKAVEDSDLTAHHLFDQMHLRLQRKKKQWKHNKTWMFKYKKEMCDSEFKNWWEIKRSFLDRFTSFKICSQPEVMMQAKLVSRACVARLSDMLKENAENGERKMQENTKQEKLLKSWRFKFRGVMETIKHVYEDAVRVLEILQAVRNGLQFDLMSFEASKENVFWTLASGYTVADKLQNLCTEMWLMDTVRWRWDKRFSDDIDDGINMSFDPGGIMECTIVSNCKENVFWTLASGYTVADKLQNLCTEMWLMDTVRWRWDKRFSDDIDDGINMSFDPGGIMECTIVSNWYWARLHITDSQGMVIDQKQ